jgi:hypothetical protein
MSTVNAFENVFTVTDDHLKTEDFSVYKKMTNGKTHYYLDIETYIGFESLDTFVTLYNKYLNKFRNYLDEHHKTSKPKKQNYTTVMKFREMEIYKQFYSPEYIQFN